MWLEVEATKILGEEVFPVCSPAYRETHSINNRDSINCSDHLLQLESGRQTWFERKAWFEAYGETTAKLNRTTTSNSYIVAVTAALAGHGVCLCWDGLLDTFLDSGALVRMGESSVKSDRGHYVTRKTGLATESPVSAVADWLIAIGIDAPGPDARR